MCLRCQLRSIPVLVWPEPFLGNPNAQVYLLNGNPGFTEGKDEKFVYEPVFLKLVLNSMSHKSTQNHDDFISCRRLGFCIVLPCFACCYIFFVK